ncbi:hypothetical protein D187_009052 [Cystobacter fuscus DSM 2262]|uniref:Uncharacterized protein n=1 Tax=Cystobacter fuscus (strain ATCC 25194 / DSM 2262 / NBRC 100088 / M29) TaxID=1242864 RepID=S9NX06_CYSF2|nr:hypothetical protein D187_009052 [Cystobacter fuscus DSM 2262]
MNINRDGGKTVNGLLASMEPFAAMNTLGGTLVRQGGDMRQGLP